MYKVVQRRMLVPNLHLLEIESPPVSQKIQPGQFIILRPDEPGERIPLSVADWDTQKGTVTSVFMEVGTSTRKLALLKDNDEIPTYVGPLGLATEIDNYGTVLCVGGCYGISTIYPLARALKEKGNRVLCAIEARSSFLLFWEEKLQSVCDDLYMVTRDGSRGMKGHIHDLFAHLQKEQVQIDRAIINGCTYLMMGSSEATRSLGINTVVNLNPIMVDGTGMCGVCRVTVGGKTRFACVDGPDFDGHEVDWKELLARRKAYTGEEMASLRRCEGQSYL